ncbi:MAG: myo-inosose-2 dehydratase [Zoogloeaceae bacterium]|jgi:inosose dehydratase|nr:myo-inosose-2 dehydratase [Zoogloeaceae bacterium]
MALFDEGGVRLGIAPIAWTNDDLPDLGGGNTFEQCVSEMALAGFAGCEVGNKYPQDAGTLKKALDLRGIQICNRWFSTFLITKPYEETEAAFIETLRFLKAMGAGVIGVSEQSHSTQGLATPVFEGRHIMDDSEWDKLTAGLNRLGKTARGMGMKLSFHHHMGTVVQTAAEVDRLMAGTNPDLVSLLFDSGHLAYCGEDCHAVLKKYAKRVGHVHLKDIRPNVVKRVKDEKLSFLDGVRAGAFTVPGDGCIDFGPIFQALAESGYRGWMVVEAEQDPAKADPLEYAIKARKYLRERAGL